MSRGSVHRRPLILTTVAVTMWAVNYHLYVRNRIDAVQQQVTKLSLAEESRKRMGTARSVRTRSMSEVSGHSATQV